MSPYYSTFTSPRKALKPFSSKRLAKLDAYEECRRIVRERAKGRCEAQELWPHRCSGPKEIHHVVTRARGGALNDPENCLYCCAFSHSWAHANPEEALRVGLLRSSWEPM